MWRIITAIEVLVMVAGLVVECFANSGKESSMPIEAILVWGTDEEKSPNPDHKPVEPEIEVKLKSQPFKWKHYYEVNRCATNLVSGKATKLQMSAECQIVLKRLDDCNVEVRMIGKGKPVATVTQPLPQGELLVLGGNAPNMTGWFVVIRQREVKTEKQ